MGVVVASGTALTGTGLDDIVITHNLGVTPVLAIFQSTYMNDAADQWEKNDVISAFGACDGTNEFYVVGTSEDNTDPTDTSMRHSTSGCLGYVNAGLTTEVGLASFSAWTTTTLTLSVSNAWGTTARFQYWIIGGTDFTNVDIGSFQWTTVAQQQTISGLGYQPDMVIAMTISNATAPDDSASDWYTSFGFATGPADADQGMVGVSSVNGQDPSVTDVYCADAAFGGRMGSGGVIELMTLNAMNGDGFVVDYDAQPAAGIYTHYITIKGGNWGVYQDATATDTNTFDLTGFGFDPIGGIVVSAGRAEDSDPGSAGLQFSIGTFDDTINQQAMLYWDDDNRDCTALGSKTYRGIDFNQVYINNDATDSVVGRMGVNLLITDGIRWQMSDADPGACFFTGFVVGAEAAPITLVPSDLPITLEVLIAAGYLSEYSAPPSEIKAYDGAAWKVITTTKVWDGVQWRVVTAGWVWNGVQWRKFYG